MRGTGRRGPVTVAPCRPPRTRERGRAPLEVGERCDGRAGALPWRVDGRESPAGRITGVHPSDSIDAALTHCFRVDNLTAPGELALLWLADRVEEGFQRYRAEHGIRTRWETREPIVVALRCEAASRAAPPARTDGARWLPGASNAARAAGRATAWRRSGAACASSGGRSPGRCRRQAWTTPRREAGAGLISRSEREEAYETLISAGQWMGGRYVEGARPRSGRTAGAVGCTDVPPARLRRAGADRPGADHCSRPVPAHRGPGGKRWVAP